MPRASYYVMKRSPVLQCGTALLLLLFLFTSCGIVIWHGAPADSSSEDSPPSATDRDADESGLPETSPITYTPEVRAEKWLDALPDYDFEGLAVIVANLSRTAFVPSDTAELLSLSAYTRNRMVEEKYHTTILERKSASVEALLEEAKAAASAGSYYADMLLLPAEALTPMLRSGKLMNLNSLPFFSTDRPYFNADAVSQFTVNGNTFALAGTLTEDPQSLYACFFNRELLAALTDRSLYDAVTDGTWTLDMMLSLLPLLPEGKQGVACYEGQDALLRVLFLASGQHFIESGEDTLPAPAFAGEKTDRLTEALHTLFFTEGGYDNRSGYDALLGFYRGESLFFIAPFYTAEWISDMQQSWGVLPLPKADEAQSAYYCSITDSACLVSVLQGTANVERLGLFIQAIFAAAGDQRNAALEYYTDTCLRDGRSIDMLEEIIGSARVDLAVIMEESYPVLTDATVSVLSDAVFLGKPVTQTYGNQLKRLRRQMTALFSNG